MNVALTWVEGPIVNSKELRAWEISLHRASPDTRIVVATYDKSAAPHTPQTEVRIFERSAIRGVHVLHRRWCAYRQILQDLSADLVLFADSRDLVFQKDPFAVVEQSDIVIASEGWPSKGHPWCAGQHREASDVFEDIGTLAGDEINGGIQVGKHAAMLFFAASMEAVMYNGLPNDQATLNYWFKRMCPSNINVTVAPEGWYIHGESVRHGKTVMVGSLTGMKVSGCEEVATVWHQYDRTGLASVVVDTYSPPFEERHMLVVSRYMEGLEWLRWTPWKNIDTFVFIKGIDKSVPYNMCLDNVGYEAQSWAWFFHTFYDKLPAVMACIQGDPFGHVTPEQLKHLWQRRMDCGWCPIADPSCSEWTDIDFPENHSALPIREWWNKLFPDEQPPLRFLSWHGGQFIVTAETVRRRSKEFWKGLSETIVTRDDACSLERLWGHIFQP